MDRTITGRLPSRPAPQRIPLRWREDAGRYRLLLEMLRNRPWPAPADPRWVYIERWAEERLREMGERA